MNKINIIIPTYNEDKNILSLIMKIKKNLPNARICIVDDSKKNIIGTILKKNNLHKIKENVVVDYKTKIRDDGKILSPNKKEFCSANI